MCIVKRAANREWNQSKRKKCVAVNKAKRSWRSEEELVSDMEMQSLEFSPLVFHLALVLYFFAIFSSLHFGMVMYILYHYMLEVCDLLFDFDFYR